MDSETRMIKVFVNAGHGSVDNGARFPGTVFRELAAAIGTEPEWGAHYGDDFLMVRSEDWQIAEELLVEAKMLYRRADDPRSGWRNVTPGSPFDVYVKQVAQRLGVAQPLAA